MRISKTEFSFPGINIDYNQPAFVAENKNLVYETATKNVNNFINLNFFIIHFSKVLYVNYVL